MRKALILTAALAMFAGPALAQQSQNLTEQAPVAQTTEAPRPAPSIHVSTETIRQQVQMAESERTGKEQVGSQSWWYLVAAIAVGVLIAVLLAG
jgi:uncharacterized lipoprotein YajG